MARRFRFLGKKRGTRRTGSQVAGTIGEGAFFSGLLLVGFASLIALVASQIIAIPGVPRTAPGSGLWLGLIVSTSLTLIGGGGFLRTVLNFGTSVERRTALAQKAAELDPRRERTKSFPTIPSQESLLLSPGTQLRFRLPLVASPMWILFAYLAYSLLWNGLLMAMTVTSVKGFQADQPRWFATFLLVPLASMAIITTRDFLSRLIEMASIGPTSAEVSDLPLVPGGEYQLCLVQAGRGKVRSLETRLVCEEEATFCQGTNVRTERRAVYDKRLFRLKDLAVRPNEPHRHLEDFEIPLNAMHSVKMTNNAVNWRFVVNGRMQRGRIISQEFSSCCFPCRKSPKNPIELEPLVSIQLFGNKPAYQPGAVLRCDYQVDAMDGNALQAIEASVLWYTEGKGDEDLGVHYFERRSPSDCEDGDLRPLRSFSVELPNSPLSYEGEILQIHWCVRVRLFAKGGLEYTSEHDFQMAVLDRDVPLDQGRVAPGVVFEEGDPMHVTRASERIVSGKTV